MRHLPLQDFRDRAAVRQAGEFIGARKGAQAVPHLAFMDLVAHGVRQQLHEDQIVLGKRPARLRRREIQGAVHPPSTWIGLPM